MPAPNWQPPPEAVEAACKAMMERWWSINSLDPAQWNWEQLSAHEKAIHLQVFKHGLTTFMEAWL